MVRGALVKRTVLAFAMTSAIVAIGFGCGGKEAAVGPAKLPADIAQKMNRALNDAMARPEVREKIAQLGFELAGSTPDEMGRFLQEQLVAWAKAFKDAGMQAE